MKKYIRIIILLLVLPIKVYAANYEITDQLIEADILNNGDLKITELIVMDGTFNGYEKTLSYKNELLEDDYTSASNNSIYNATDLELLEVRGKYVKEVDFDTFKDNDFKTFLPVDIATNGNIAKYTTFKNINGYTYRLYYPSNKDKVAFLISYVLKNVIVMHEDVAELYWNFITPNDYDDIANVKVHVNLPGRDNSDNFRIWAHGDLAGEISKNEDNNMAIASINYMEASSLLDIRLTFDKDLISNTTNIKYDYNINLDDIIEVEEQRANAANELRDKLKRRRNIIITLTYLIYIGGIILGIYFYFKYGKNPKKTYFSKYNREFIDDYNVEVVDYLMNRKITPNAMSASIMNLIYKKNILVEEILGNKDKDYKFILNNINNINESEDLLIKFLFDKIGNTNEKQEKSFKLSDLKKYAKGTKTCSSFINSYTKWQENVLNISKQEEFYVISSTPKIGGVLVMFICLLFTVYASSLSVDYFLTYLLPVFGIIFLIYSILLIKKTPKGMEHYTKWVAFKNFLDDFGSFELKELPEVVLWERYLVYATVFGLAKKVQKVMNVKINEIDISNGYYIPSYLYFDIGNTISYSVSNAVSSAYQRQAANYANTHSSSSSGGGFGGGFSSGGGFGGGGSSGHGF